LVFELLQRGHAEQLILGLLTLIMTTLAATLSILDKLLSAFLELETMLM
jgi:hypothetical protein